MNFTSDWVTPNEPNFKKCMEALGGSRHRFLEIGSFEGRSTCWFLQNGLEKDGFITCIDTFKPYWYEGNDLQKIFQDNVNEARQYMQVISTYSMASPLALAQLISSKQLFDFVYIDGDHSAGGVMTDAVMAWQLLRSGGVMLFDDYEYETEPTKCGIDGFLMGFVGKYDLLLKNYQLAVVKK